MKRNRNCYKHQRPAEQICKPLRGFSRGYHLERKARSFEHKDRFTVEPCFSNHGLPAAAASGIQPCAPHVFGVADAAIGRDEIVGNTTPSSVLPQTSPWMPHRDYGISITSLPRVCLAGSIKSDKACSASESSYVRATSTWSCPSAARRARSSRSPSCAVS
jgi:hypothetical protein